MSKPEADAKPIPETNRDSEANSDAKVRLKKWWVIPAILVESVALLVLVKSSVPSWLVAVTVWMTLLTIATWFYFNILEKGPTEKDKKEQRNREERESHDLRSPIDDEDERKKKWFELRKLEYEKAADRYDNIYRAVWQNFAYLAVLSGGILAFGTRDLDWAAAFFLALTPLTFWYFAQFHPMDHYGDETRKRLSAIEDDLNRMYFPLPSDLKIRHFTSFKVSKYRWRVRNAVHVFGVAVSATWLLMLVLAVDRTVISGKSAKPATAQALQLEPQPFQIELPNSGVDALRDSLSALSTRVHVVDSLVRCQLDAIKARRRPAC